MRRRRPARSAASCAAACSISSLAASLRYQSSVKPTHSALSLESLNENSDHDRPAGRRGRRRPRARRPTASGDLTHDRLPLARARRQPAAIASTATVSISDSIEPNGQSRVPRKLSLIRLPTSQSSLPPRISGIANMPSTGMKTSAEPEKMPGQRQREGHAPEAVPGVGAQVLRRVEQRRVVLLEVGVERQDHERQVHVDHADDHREAREQEVERAEDDHPGVDAHQEVAGEGQDHQQHHEVAVLLRAARDQQRQRIGHDQADERGERGDAEATWRRSARRSSRRRRRA